MDDWCGNVLNFFINLFKFFSFVAVLWQDTWPNPVAWTPLHAQVYDCEEWSFGYSGSGSGVFSCAHKGNPSYSYRETISLGQTSLSRLKVTQVLFELGREWPGNSYDLLSRNCNHFCDAFCERLGVRRLPGDWQEFEISWMLALLAKIFCSLN